MRLNVIGRIVLLGLLVIQPSLGQGIPRAVVSMNQNCSPIFDGEALSLASMFPSVRIRFVERFWECFFIYRRPKIAQPSNDLTVEHLAIQVRKVVASGGPWTASITPTFVAELELSPRDQTIIRKIFYSFDGEPRKADIIEIIVQVFDALPRTDSREVPDEEKYANWNAEKVLSHVRDQLQSSHSEIQFPEPEWILFGTFFQQFPRWTLRIVRLLNTFTLHIGEPLRTYDEAMHALEILVLAKSRILDGHVFGDKRAISFVHAFIHITGRWDGKSARWKRVFFDGPGYEFVAIQKPRDWKKSYRVNGVLRLTSDGKGVILTIPFFKTITITRNDQGIPIILNSRPPNLRLKFRTTSPAA